MKLSSIARIDRTLMGVKCTVTIAGSDSAVIAQKCLDSIENHEQLWSRFRPTSDITRLNHSNGSPIWVDPLTLQLLHYMKAAFLKTEGAFNPTLLPLQLDAGDKFSLIDDGFTEAVTGTRCQTSMDNIVLHEDGRVQLLDGTQIDAGGIAKGLSADLVRDFALNLGAIGACINIGGDMAIHTGSNEGWLIDIMSPTHGDQTIESILISHGGVATSAVNARHRNGSHIENHIFTVNGNEDSGTLSATVVASHAAWAEAWSKFAIINNAQKAINTIEQNGLAAFLVRRDGTTYATNSWKELQQ